MIPVAAICRNLCLATLVTWMGIAYANVTVIVNFSTGVNDGFNSNDPPDPVSPAPGSTLGEQRRASFQAAADYWGLKLTSNVTIIVDAEMIPKSCNPFGAILGSAGTQTAHGNFAGAGFLNTWYHASLANKIANADLSASNDIFASFNVSIDNNNACLIGTNWYYDVFPGTGPAGTISFFDVVLHEIGHGVGVSTFVASDGSRFMGFDDVYMKFLEDHDLGLMWPAMTTGQIYDSQRDTPNTHWVGPAVQAAIGILSGGGGVSNGHPMVYAPDPFEGGSSISHWDKSMETIDSVDERMEPSFEDGAEFLLTNELLEDIGWGPVFPVPVTLASFQAVASARGAAFTWSTATEVGTVGFNLYAHSDRGWQRINPVLIAAEGGDSLETRTYGYEAAKVESKLFAIEDVDVDGRTQRRGAFEMGVRYGHQATNRAIDWDSIRAQHRTNSESRTEALVRDGLAGVSLMVNETGIHRVSYEQLQAAGIDWLGVGTDGIALSSRGKPVPIHIEGGKRFGPGSFIEFYGEGIESLYTHTNRYALTSRGENPSRVQVESRPPLPGVPAVPSYLDQTTLEREREYSFASPIGDPWFDTPMLVYEGNPQSFSFDLEVDRLVPRQAATLEIGMWGITNFPQEPDHHVLISLNGVVLDDASFDGLVDASRRVAIPHGLLREGLNQVQFVLPGDTGLPYDLVHLDRVGINYGRAFQARSDELMFEARGSVIRVSGFTVEDILVYRIDRKGVARLSDVSIEPIESGSYTVRFQGERDGAQYILTDQARVKRPEIRLESPLDPGILSGSAQYLIISHPDFLDGLQPLVAARIADGYSVKTVDVNQLYLHYSHGIVDPQAIREYIEHAANHLGTEMVLLVGGDSYDYHDYLGLGSISFIPTLYTKVHPVVNFSPSDPLFTDLDGDDVPDLPIGRLPVRSSAELQSVLTKILSYPTAGHAGTALFVADRAEAEASYSQLSEIRIDQLPPDWSVDRVFLDEMDVTLARSHLLEALNQGPALTHYFGHSGPTVWTFDGLFHADDAGQLTNFGKPTVAVQWGCWNSYYVAATYETLAHRFLLAGQGGAAAVLGGATLTQVSSDKLLGGLLMPRLTTLGVTLGDALTDAKRELAQTRPDLKDVLLGWTLLGDPALVIQALP